MHSNRRVKGPLKISERREQTSHFHSLIAVANFAPGIAILLTLAAVASAAPRQPIERRSRQDSITKQQLIQEHASEQSDQEQVTLEQTQNFPESVDTSESNYSQNQRQERQFRPQQGQQNLRAPTQIKQEQKQFAQPEIVVLKEVLNNNIGLDGYRYSYELSDGQKREETAEVVANPRAATDKNGDEPAVFLRVRGSYSYFNPYDGKTYTVNYIADENGFQPQGEHIPSLQ
ncbi:hypothetical protein QAD02_016155 [Eretmocerus hayati]|uniref:Uncharacterized protein n=1 Tax=Eretmocerus hayati TaxID=131215 RepID=A0ACC2PB91_9HYME|nr:hypothetical protein QAD02_016155 [Eretmocerus hayati]